MVESLGRNRFDLKNSFIDRLASDDFSLNLETPQPSRIGDIFRDGFELIFDGATDSELQNLETNFEDQEFLLKNGSGESLAVQNIDAEIDGSSLNLDFPTFSGGIGFLDPEEILNNTFINGLPDNIPGKQRFERFLKSGNPEILEGGFNTGRDVFRALGIENLSINTINSSQSSGNNKSVGTDNSNMTQNIIEMVKDNKVLIAGAGLVAVLVME